MFANPADASPAAPRARTPRWRSALLPLLVATALAGFGSAAAPPAFAAPAAPPLAAPQAGYYRLMVGDVEVIALSDGSIGLDAALLQSDDRPAIDAALEADHAVSPLDTSVNAYLVRTGPRLVLIDAGAGSLFGPSLSKLPASLAAVGIAPAQITDVLVTHVHTDHTGGLMDGPRRVFPNAAVHLDRREIAYWLDPRNEALAPVGQKAFFQQARASIEPYQAAGQLRPFDGAVEVVPGLRSVPAPGHTPGHTFYRLEPGRTLLFWGDVMHVAEVQLRQPSVTIAYDVDPAAAAAQRQRAFADAADRGELVAPAHLSFPGVGHLRRDGPGYRWLPLRYLNDASAAR